MEISRNGERLYVGGPEGLFVIDITKEPVIHDFYESRVLVNS